MPPYFRDFIVAAPLKREIGERRVRPGDLFPRLHCRGPIEAGCARWRPGSAPHFRDFIVAAPLKRPVLRPGSREGRNFRDFIVAAPLKQKRASLLDWTRSMHFRDFIVAAPLKLKGLPDARRLLSNFRDFIVVAPLKQV